MTPYRTRIRCYDCRRPIKGNLYIEREVRPYAYVPICEGCEPTWAVLRRMEKKGLLQSLPEAGIVLTPLGKLHYRQSGRCLGRRDREE